MHSLEFHQKSRIWTFLISLKTQKIFLSGKQCSKLWIDFEWIYIRTVFIGLYKTNPVIHTKWQRKKKFTDCNGAVRSMCWKLVGKSSVCKLWKVFSGKSGMETVGSVGLISGSLQNVNRMFWSRGGWFPEQKKSHQSGNSNVLFSPWHLQNEFEWPERLPLIFKGLWAVQIVNGPTKTSWGGGGIVVQWHSHFLLFLCSQQWLLDKQDVLRERQPDLKVLTEEEYQKIMIFFTNRKCFEPEFYHKKGGKK